MVLPYINMNPPRVYTCSPSWTPLPPRSPYHPSGSSQCTSPEHPVSCMEPGLVIHFTYDIIHVLIYSSILAWRIPWTEEFGGRRRWRGWVDLGEWHWNMCNIIYEMKRQSRFDAWYRMLGAGALGWPRGMVWGGRLEGGSGWGTRVYPWRIHVDVWQNQYNIVK